MKRSEVGLLLGVLCALVVVRIALLLFPFEKVRTWASTTKQENMSDVSTRKMSWGIAKAAMVVPGATCLTQALALQKLLARSNRTSCLHIGVARRQGEFSAHAWLVQDGEILIGDSEASGHKTLVRWGSPNVEDS